MPSGKSKSRTIDQYLAAASDGQRAALQRLRKTIRSVVPKAEECISYGLPAFRLNGHALLAFGATGQHCAFYPMSSVTVAAHRGELRDFDTSKGTIRFPPDKPLPVALVRKLVKARLAELPTSHPARVGTSRKQPRICGACDSAKKRSGKH